MVEKNYLYKGDQQGMLDYQTLLSRPFPFVGLIAGLPDAAGAAGRHKVFVCAFPLAIRVRFGYAVSLQ